MRRLDLHVRKMAGVSSKATISPSLLLRIDSKKKTSKDFSLGMSDWTDSDKENEPFNDDEDFQPPHRKKA